MSSLASRRLEVTLWSERRGGAVDNFDGIEPSANTVTPPEILPCRAGTSNVSDFESVSMR